VYELKVVLADEFSEARVEHIPRQMCAINQNSALLNNTGTMTMFFIHVKLLICSTSIFVG